MMIIFGIILFIMILFVAMITIAAMYLIVPVGVLWIVERVLLLILKNNPKYVFPKMHQYRKGIWPWIKRNLLT